MYKVEIFDGKAGAFRFSFMADESFDIITDLMAPQTFDIPAPKELKAELFDTVIIAKDTEIVWFGFIKEINKSKFGANITAMHPLQALDIPVRTTASPSNIGYEVYAAIYSNFLRDTCIVGKLPFVYNSAGGAYSNWNKAPLYANEIITVKDLIVEAGKSYNLFMNWQVYRTGANIGKIGFSFKPVSAVVHLDITDDLLLSKSVDENRNFGNNIGIIWVKTSSGSGYYSACIIDGVFSMDMSEGLRRTIKNPSVIVEDWTEDDEWTYDEVEQRLKEMLPVASDNLNIKIQVPNDTKLVTNLSDGARYILHDKDLQYTASLTGRRIAGNIVELTFGTVRATLTEKLTNERKK